jgi:GntR family transcriptional regulator
MHSTRGRLPLYFQIESVLRERIRSGQYVPAAAFPTEDALQKEFAVSRGTVRLALEALHREGLIVRYPGRGAFVSQRTGRPRTLRFGGSIEELIGHGAAETRFLVTERLVTVASPEEATELKIAGDRRIVRITGLRMRGAEAVARAVISVPEALGILLGLRPGESYPPVAALLVEQLGQVIREARQVIDVAMADEATSTALRLAPGSPLLRIRRTYFGGDGSPVEYAVSSYPAGRFQYETTIST